MKNKAKNKVTSKATFKRFLKVAFIYFLLFLSILGMIDYYAMMAYSFKLILIISIILALPIGFYHTLKSKHTHIDDVADELL